jgi:hypothetical protein
MKYFLKNAVVMLGIAIGFSACDKDLKIEFNDAEFCSCLNMKDIHKTIPIVNEFLSIMPKGISEEQKFQSLAKWLKSFPCIIDTTYLRNDFGIWPDRRICRVAFTFEENGIIKELSLDFLPSNPLEIAGYIYDKQNTIHVGTKYTKINDVFGFINSFDLDVQEIQYGTYISSMPADSANLKYIRNILISKPYTNDVWVTGQLNGYLSGITFFVRLYDMKNKKYQEDWIKTMREYELIKYDYPDYKESIIDGITYGPGDAFVFYIPEGTGKQWEGKFRKHDYVRWAELSHTRYYIQ